jgi:hypothetical protein
VAVGRANPDSYPTNLVNSQGNPTVNRPMTVRQGQSPREQPGTHMVMPSERNRPSLLENPLAVGGLAIGLAAIAGFGGWAVVQTLDTAVTPTPTITSLPPLGSESPTPTPKPTLTQAPPKPVEYEQPDLGLVLGETKTVEGNMRKGDKVNYPFIAEAGQTLTVEQFEEDVRLSVLGPNGEPINSRARDVFEWEGALEEAGEYRIQLSPVGDVKSSDYRLAVTLNGAAPTAPEVPPTTPPPATETPGEPPPTTAPPTQTQVQEQRVSFPSGSEGVQLQNQVGPGQIRRYVVNAQEGQILSVKITGSQGGSPYFDVLMPGGEMVADASGIVWWEGFLPVGGDYAIEVSADQSSEFTLAVQAFDQIPTEPGQ